MRKTITILTLICLTLGGCKFFEECDYYGAIKLELDYSAIWKDVPKPDSLSIAVFSGNQNIMYHEGLRNDTTYQPILSGKQRLIVWNNAPTMNVTSANNLGLLEFAYSTEMQGKSRRIVSAPMLALHEKELNIPMEGIVEDLVSPEPKVKKIIFTHKLFLNGQPMNEKVSLLGLLGGLSYRYSYSQGVLPGLAEMEFEPTWTKDNIYTSSFFTFGANTKSDNIHYLVVHVNGTRLEFEIPLRDVLTKFEKDILYITLNVDLAKLENDIQIADWKEETWESIIIQ